MSHIRSVTFSVTFSEKTKCTRFISKNEVKMGAIYGLYQKRKPFFCFLRQKKGFYEPNYNRY